MRIANGVKPAARILLVEDDHWEAGLVQEAVEELEERPHQNLLGRSIDLYHATSLQQALGSTRADSYDLILLDLATGGSAGLAPFLRLRENAPDTPFVILSSAEDETLALTAMREGAAGYLLKEDLDCLPLARALRAALERQHALTARRSMPWVDELTGLSSRAGFLYLGDMALRLGARWSRPARLSVVTLAGYERSQDAYGAQMRDLALIETAEMVRDLFPDADLLARTGVEEFAVLTVGSDTRGEHLGERTAAWLAARNGRHSHVPALEFVTQERTIRHAGVSLEELLATPEQQAVAVPQ